MYIEFVLLLVDYFRSLERKYIYYEWLVPLFFVIGIYFFIDNNKVWALSGKFIEASITLLGILVGFSITVISLLNTANNQNVEEIKKVVTNYSIGGTKISLFQL